MARGQRDRVLPTRLGDGCGVRARDPAMRAAPCVRSLAAGALLFGLAPPDFTRALPRFYPVLMGGLPSFFLSRLGVCLWYARKSLARFASVDRPAFS